MFGVETNSVKGAQAKRIGMCESSKWPRVASIHRQTFLLMLMSILNGLFVASSHSQFGKTAVKLAKDNGHDECAEYISKVKRRVQRATMH